MNIIRFRYVLMLPVVCEIVLGQDTSQGPVTGCCTDSTEVLKNLVEEVKRLNTVVQSTNEKIQDTMGEVTSTLERDREEHKRWVEDLEERIGNVATDVLRRELGKIKKNETDTSTSSYNCTEGSPTLILRNDIAGSNAGAFNQSLSRMKHGFGSPTSQYWIGLDRLNEMTQRSCMARFDLQLLDGTRHFAQYSSFSVGNSSSNYKITIGGYSGDLYDAMEKSNGQPFTTYDVDNDAWSNNCAMVYGGGFWFNACGRAFVTTSPASNFYWYTGNYYYYLKVAEVCLMCW